MLLARFAEAVHPEPRPLKDEQTSALSALLSRRRQVVDRLTAEKNRLPTVHKQVRKELKVHIQYLEKRLKNVGTDLQDWIQDSPPWRVNDDILQSVPGVAPMNRDSGAYRDQRLVWGGRRQIRNVLYMATLAAIRLIASGKKPKVAIVACMRTLLTILNAMLRDKTYWQQAVSGNQA